MFLFPLWIYLFLRLVRELVRLALIFATYLWSFWIDVGILVTSVIAAQTSGRHTSSAWPAAGTSDLNGRVIVERTGVKAAVESAALILLVAVSAAGLIAPASAVLGVRNAMGAHCQRITG
jgi:hypothetical protein